MSRHRLTTVGVLAAGLATAFGSPAPAQDRTPAQLTGSLLALLITADMCEGIASPEQRDALASAGERMQAKAGVPTLDLEAAVSEITQGVRARGCGEARGRFPDTYREVMEEVRRVPRVPGG